MSLQNTARFPANVATDGDLLNQANVFSNSPQCSLAVALNSTDRTATVNNYSTLPLSNFTITIDQEIIFVAANTSGSLTGLVRGFEGSTAASHLQNAVAAPYITAWAHNQLAAEVAAIETALGANMQNVVGGLTPTSLQMAQRSLDNSSWMSVVARAVKSLQYTAIGNTPVTNTNSILQVPMLGVTLNPGNVRELPDGMGFAFTAAGNISTANSTPGSLKFFVCVQNYTTLASNIAYSLPVGLINAPWNASFEVVCVGSSSGNYALETYGRITINGVCVDIATSSPNVSVPLATQVTLNLQTQWSVQTPANSITQRKMLTEYI